MGAFQWAVRQSCEVENLMVSVERIHEYTLLQSEPAPLRPETPPDNWPSKYVERRATLSSICFPVLIFHL
jgi:ATP-binding cassette subfamily C (CFTR/MRP) protein 4